MKKAMLCIMTACLSLMFAPEALMAADKCVANRALTEIPVKSPVEPVNATNNEVRPDPATQEKESKKGSWVRHWAIYMSGAALVLLIVLLILLL
ncbi:MAG TPA: hypothetical protein VI731_01210 [Bacteroidia bacterium]|nr:hypothetical protein [Bacteroidia bacterium]